MRRNLAAEHFGEGLRQPWLATMATFRADGSVLMSPVWFLWEDGHFKVGLVRDDWKERHLRANPHVGLCIAEEASFPGRVCEAWGNAEMHDDPVGVQMERIASKYLGDRLAKKWVEQFVPLAVEWVTMVLRPDRMRLLDHRDETELLDAEPQYIPEAPRSRVS